MKMEVLKDLTYNPKTGKFFWVNPDKYHLHLLGKEAGSLNNKGYIYITHNKIHYPAHRLAFLFMEDYLPKEVDHIDRDKSNNKFINLRATTRSKNIWNTVCRSTNLLKLKHIRKTKENTFQVRIDGKSLGCFRTIEEALLKRNVFLLTERLNYNQWMISEIGDYRGR